MKQYNYTTEHFETLEHYVPRVKTKLTRAFSVAAPTLQNSHLHPSIDDSMQ